MGAHGFFGFSGVEHTFVFEHTFDEHTFGIEHVFGLADEEPSSFRGTRGGRFWFLRFGSRSPIFGGVDCD